MKMSSLLRAGSANYAHSRARRRTPPCGITSGRVRALLFERLEQRSLLAGDVSAPMTSDAVGDPAPAIFALAAPRVEFTLQLARPDGSPLTTLAVGDEFVVRVFVQDMREAGQGVFAAYLDVEWDPAKAVSTGVVNYGAEYFNGRHASITTPGLIDEAGGIAYLAPVGGNRLELFTATLRATAPGLLEFTANPADVPDTHDIVTYSRPGEPSQVPDDATSFRGVSIEVTVAAPAPLPDAATALPPATVLAPMATSPVNDAPPPADAGAIAEPVAAAISAEPEIDVVVSAAVAGVASPARLDGSLLGMLALSINTAPATLVAPANTVQVLLDESLAAAPAEQETVIDDSRATALDDAVDSTGSDDSETENMLLDLEAESAQ